MQRVTKYKSHAPKSSLSHHFWYLFTYFDSAVNTILRFKCRQQVTTKCFR